jgi:hypothetical protein
MNILSRGGLVISERTALARTPWFPLSRSAARPVSGGTWCRWLLAAAEMAGLVNNGANNGANSARPPRIAARPLSADAGSVRAARDFTVATLRGWGAAEAGSDIAVVVSELLTNALRHAVPADLGSRWPVRLGLLQRGPWVLCAVADPSPAVPVPQAPDSLDETGRGLQMICALSERWGYTALGDAGKAVWAMFYVRPTARGV